VRKKKESGLKSRFSEAEGRTERKDTLETYEKESLASIQHGEDTL
jgi:hypothetical protein